MATVTMIPAKTRVGTRTKTEDAPKLRVAAYCRVSTDDIDQAISIALQIKEYKQKIKSNPNWKYVGTYVDAADIIGLNQNPCERALI